MKIARVLIAIICFIGSAFILPRLSGSFYNVAFTLLGVGFTWVFIVSSAIAAFVFTKVKG